jgi:GMP synthase-like glutamine amidotransferase
MKKIHLIDVTDFTLPDGSGSAEWFTDAFEALDLLGEAELIIHDGTALDFPSIDDCAGDGSGVIVSGSHGPVWQEKAWIPPLMDFIREIHGRGGWLLGVCFGHQALGHALGGEVVMNPRGREFGTVPVYLTEEGRKSPLFEGFSSGDMASLSHRTHVSRLPEGAVRLAFNQMTPNQAFSIGRSFGYQPHPELTPRQLRLMTELYGSVLVRKEKFLDSEAHMADFRDSFVDAPSSMAVLRNFTRLTG